MKNIISSAALTASLALTGLTAHASCADPRSSSQQGAFQQVAPLHLPQEALANHGGQNADEAIVGTWHVVYTSGGSPFGDAFIQWHRDGTEWENINLPVLGGNLCMGEWKALDRWHVFRNHFGWLYTSGIVSGYFNETETNLLSLEGNSYSGTNETKIYDLSGTLLVTVPGTSAATRIAL